MVVVVVVFFVKATPSFPKPPPPQKKSNPYLNRIIISWNKQPVLFWESGQTWLNMMTSPYSSLVPGRFRNGTNVKKHTTQPGWWIVFSFTQVGKFRFLPKPGVQWWDFLEFLAFIQIRCLLMGGLGGYATLGYVYIYIYRNDTTYYHHQYYYQ